MPLIGKISPFSQYCLRSLAPPTHFMLTPPIPCCISSAYRHMHTLYYYSCDSSLASSPDYIPYIVTFGVYGDGLDNVVRSPQDAGIRVLCGVGLLNATPLWYNSVGVVMGGGNGRRVSQSRLRNGTAVLEFVPDGFLTLCDAGTYSCRASGGGVGRDERMFSLTIGSK